MGAAWEAGLTHGLQVPVCIQHHLPVKVPLGSIQQLPFLLSEGHTHTSLNNTCPCNRAVGFNWEGSPQSTRGDT